MNKVILMGRITADPELRQTKSGTEVLRFSIAVNRRFNKEVTDFFNCVAWKSTAVFIDKYFGKGDMIAVVGELQTRTWDDEKGVKHYATDINIDEAYFAGAKRNTQEAKANEENDPFDNINLPGEFEEISTDESDLPF